MNKFIGIDLGTTNSAIAIYDLNEVKVLKSPSQNDVTPSAIYIGKRGNKYYGTDAYNLVGTQPSRVATLFKRLLGTKKKYEFKTENGTIKMTPEECSAEIIKVLLGYLPDGNTNDYGIIITVPANFDTMKKNATLEAAQKAGVNNIALMQEPVAAVIASQRSLKSEGNYIIYDLGGGTFDVTIAQCKNGKVNLLANGGIDTCGGRDIDLGIFDSIVKPWLDEKFDIEYMSDSYKNFKASAYWAIEKAKIELSSKESSSITLDENQTKITDLNDEEVYLDIPLTRDDINGIIKPIVESTVKETISNLKKADLTTNDINEIIFIGGPTNYLPLKEMVSDELKLKYNNTVNPMTAVAEGASIYAESIDWSKENHAKKSSIGSVKTNVDVNFSYQSRVTTNKTNIIPVLGDGCSKGLQIEIRNKQNGWTSGRLPLENKKIIEVPIDNMGENEYEISIIDESGKTISKEEISILKTYTSIDSIPASHSIGIEIKDNIYSNSTILEFLVEEGQKLPAKGEIKLKAADSLKAGEPKKLNFKLWEGSDKNNVTNNKFIGCLSICGNDFDYGIINKYSEILCKYEVSDAGNISLSVEIPDINSVFGKGQNFYSRQDAEIGIDDINSILDTGEALLNRINKVSEIIKTKEMEEAKNKVLKTMEIKDNYDATEEDVQKAQNALLEAKKMVSNEENNKEVKKQVRQYYLEERKQMYETDVKPLCDEDESRKIESLLTLAQRSIDMDTDDFDNIMSEISGEGFVILYWKNDGFAIDYFRRYLSTGPFVNNKKAGELITLGKQAIANDNMNELRRINKELSNLKIYNGGGEDMTSNIIKG